MDGYVGVESDNFSVSKRQKSSLRFPSSPDYFLHWGVANSEDFESPNEYCIGAANLTSEELKVEVETSIRGESSTESSWCEEFPFVDCRQMNPEASLDRTKHLGDQPDYQLDGIGGIDQTDDIFLSLFEETPPGMENPYRSICMYLVSDSSAMTSENLLTEMIVDSQSISVDTSDTNSPKDLDSNTHYFPSSAAWDREENTPNFMPVNSEKMEDCSMKKEPAVLGLIHAELNSPCKGEINLNAGRSLEESVLQELEVAMAQVKLTKSTRICFRDSFYRLAKSSEQPHAVSQTQSGENSIEKHSMSPVPHRTSRFQKVNGTDYQTNTIDRTIEKLMYDKLDCDTTDLSSDASVDLSKETVMMEASTSYCFNWTLISPSPRCSVLPQDAYTSTFGGENKTMIDFY
ncbi:protein LNK3-like isoform X2 [Macadamia integrifolia]|uniref:protein LNK3-like isoform X2 n=1 Tax=Macadamia integrifolia TaxID=60698 RepID=UPI001C5329A2|nr:protein LNK3-like isoform X2 [Macadamia integrifolia]